MKKASGKEGPRKYVNACINTSYWGSDLVNGYACKVTRKLKTHASIVLFAILSFDFFSSSCPNCPYQSLVSQPEKSASNMFVCLFTLFLRAEYSWSSIHQVCSCPFFHSLCVCMTLSGRRWSFSLWKRKSMLQIHNAQPQKTEKKDEIHGSAV